MSATVTGIPQEILKAAAQMPAARARMVLAALAAKESEISNLKSEMPAELAEAASAFERDMQPVRKAIAEALQDGDLEALRGLRAMLPTLLAEVNESPELADVLAYQVGKTVLEAMAE